MNLRRGDNDRSAEFTVPDNFQWLGPLVDQDEGRPDPSDIILLMAKPFAKVGEVCKLTPLSDTAGELRAHASN